MLYRLYAGTKQEQYVKQERTKYCRHQYVCRTWQSGQPQSDPCQRTWLWADRERRKRSTYPALCLLRLSTQHGCIGYADESHQRACSTRHKGWSRTGAFSGKEFGYVCCRWTKPAETVRSSGTRRSADICSGIGPISESSSVRWHIQPWQSRLAYPWTVYCGCLVGVGRREEWVEYSHCPCQAQRRDTGSDRRSTYHGGTLSERNGAFWIRWTGKDFSNRSDNYCP